MESRSMSSDSYVAVKSRSLKPRYVSLARLVALTSLIGGSDDMAKTVLPQVADAYKDANDIDKR